MAKKKQQEKLKSTVGALVADGFSTLQGLGEELREWYDNLPQQFQDNRSDIDEAASALENLNEPDDAPEIIAELEVEYVNTIGKRTGRAARGGQASYEMGLAVERAEAWLEEQEAALKTAAPFVGEDNADDIQQCKDEIEKINAKPGAITDEDRARRNVLTVRVDAYDAVEAGSQSHSPEERIEDVREWVDAVREIIDEADGVEYPGMYG